MFRIIIIIGLVLLAIPFYNKAKDYISAKAKVVETVGKSVVNAVERKK